VLLLWDYLAGSCCYMWNLCEGIMRPSTTTLFRKTLCTLKHTKCFDHKGLYQLCIIKIIRKNYFAYKREICFKNGIAFLKQILLLYLKEFYLFYFIL